MPDHLHPREVDLFRSLKKTAIVLMVLFRLDRPLGESEVAGVLDLNVETARIYLRSLASLGMVTRTHRCHGWILTAGGRQMVLGEHAGAGCLHIDPGNQEENIKTTAEIPRSLPAGATNAGASAENPSSTAEIPRWSAENAEPLPEAVTTAGASAENPRSSAEIPRWTAEFPRSLPVAAASLSLNSLSLKASAAAAIAEASAENPRSSAEIPRSRLRPRIRKTKKEDRSANGYGRPDRLLQANLEALASIGLAQNDFVLGICRMAHVTPNYILGQKSRLEAERRYSAGLLLTVIQSKDALPEKYTIYDSSPPLSPIPSPEQGSERCSPSPLPLPSDVFVAAPTASRQHSPDIEPDPSIHEPLSGSGITAAKAWPAVLRELQTDMPKAAYDKWVRETVLLSARNGTFVIGARSDYARDWLESRLTSTITRLLAGICNRGIEVKFIYRD